MGCARCGGPPGLRTEQCYITDDTRTKLLAHAETLKQFGVTFEETRSLGKSVDALEVIGLALAVAASLDSGVLRKLVIYVGDLAIPEEEILRLQLNEPEAISAVLRDEYHRGEGTA